VLSQIDVESPSDISTLNASISYVGRTRRRSEYKPLLAASKVVHSKISTVGKTLQRRLLGVAETYSRQLEGVV